jgi:hypothetical protein
VRIRIQDGSEDDASNPWRELPSQLHLEILQLLQDADDSDDATGGSIVVAELFDALKEVRGDFSTGFTDAEIEEIEGVPEEVQGGGRGPLPWTEVRDALKWLSQEALVSFEVPGEGDDIDPATLFKGAEVVDMRTTR